MKATIEIREYDESTDTFVIDLDYHMSDGGTASNVGMVVPAAVMPLMVRKFGEPAEFLEERHFTLEV